MFSLINSAQNETTSILDVLEEFNNGNFDADIPKMPGKKAVINERVDRMRRRMKNISGEIEDLTAQAINGNLSFRAGAGKYGGGWRSVIEGLNALLDAIIEPVNKTMDMLGEMSRGNLRVRITEDYSGDFASMKDSLNSTAETISSYIEGISGTLNELADDNLNQEVTREYVGQFGNINPR